MCAHQIDDELILALTSEQHVKQAFSGGLADEAYVMFEASATNDAGPPMQLIDDFCTRLSLACESRNDNQKHVMILPENNSDLAITSASMLLGSFLILRHGLTNDAVQAAFQSLSDRFVQLKIEFPPDDEQEVTVHDCCS
jgi:hypothetical protein